MRTLQSPIPIDIQRETDVNHRKIHDLFKAVSPDLQGSNAWRWQRQISGGIQEYMEAISFHHYLETQSLITFAEAQARIPFDITLTEDDYILGLFDLTGELMRFAITTMATTGTLSRGVDSDRDILSDLRQFRTSFESLDTTSGNESGSPLKRDVEKKMEVMRTCVEKVENAVYGMIIRGRERPQGWVPEADASGAPREVESY